MSSAPLYTAHQRFSSAQGEAWINYLQWFGSDHLEELISTDTLLCPKVIEELNADDWNHNVHEDLKTELFRNWEYLKHRIGYDPSRHNLLTVVECPLAPPSAESDFEFCGYDIVDDASGGISLVTDCGGFPTVFEAAEVNRFGLLDDLARAEEIATAIRAIGPEDYHCRDCRVWGLSRYVGKL